VLIGGDQLSLFDAPARSGDQADEDDEADGVAAADEAVLEALTAG